MEALFLLLILIVLVVAVYLWWKSRTGNGAATARHNGAAKAPSDPLADWSSAGGDQQFRELKPGDLVKSDEGDHLVRGTISFSEGGSVWHEHLLEAGPEAKQWLSVEDDEGLELALWQRIPMADVESGGPGDRSVVVRGVAYKLVENGSAAYTALGSTGTGSGGQVDYVDYEAADRSLLGFEKYDNGNWEAALGRAASPSQFDIYPSGQLS